jgi:superfamily II DNA or RNA helicase
MEAIITNKLIVIKNPTEDIVRYFEKKMSYIDKQKQFQVTKMEKNPFNRNSKHLLQLKKEVNCSLLKRIDNKHIVINSGFSYLVSNMHTVDKRIDTGTCISLPWKNKPHTPREYQEEAIDAMMNNWRGVVNMATGMGKTLTAIHLIKRIKRKTLIVVPSESIAKQFYKELSDAFGEQYVGYFGGGKKKIKDITVGIAASITNNLSAIKEADLGVVIFDEVHHIAANTFYDISIALGDVGRIYGLTATDFRSDGKDIMITAGCGSVIVKKDIKWGIDNGFLAKPKFIVKQVNTEGRDFPNDKLKNYKEHVLNNDLMKNQIRSDVAYYIAQGKSVLCLIGEVSHGEELSKALGVPFAQGKDKRSQEYVDDLNSGKIKCLIGTAGKISEGTDTKNVDVLILASFVASKGPVIQSVGRALRKQGDKTEALIIDYIPMGSTMLTRHANNRISIFKEITSEVEIVR